MGRRAVEQRRIVRRERIELAKQLRRASTQAELVLWEELRNRRLDGLKFRRQQALGPYVVDFYCIEYRLVVELDGEIHNQQREYDEARTAYLEAHALSVIRFGNDDVLNRMTTVLSRMRAAIDSLGHPSPAHGRGAGGEGSPVASEITPTR